jgi:hypothetical protein
MEFYDFIGEKLSVNDYVVYLKNTRTGSSTIKKCKYIGVIVDFTKNNVKIRALSRPDRYEIDWENKNESVLVEAKDIIMITDCLID